MNLEQFLDSAYWEMMQHDINLNIQHWHINDRDRAKRMHKAFAQGNFGISHREAISDMHDGIACAYSDGVINEEELDTIYAELKELEQWHRDNGSIDELI